MVMNFIKNNILTICLVALFCLFGFAGDAAATATGSSIMTTATDKARNVFNSVKTIIFVVGGFGLVGIAWAAIFGKINWKWFAALAVGLAIVAAAASIINYATGDNTGLDMNRDTFGKS
jgi:type IV secretory pathway VirB2 component (pilin)